MILILFIAAIQDMFTYKVSNYITLLLLIITILNGEFYWYTFLIMIICFYLLSILFPKKMGGADYKILIILSIYQGFNIYFVILFASTSAIIFSKMLNKNKVPFVPFIFLGEVLCQILIT